mmetsp:Transcript_22999/g.42336  ORF Transcript_22999/g.42336 Transcript_22999/m.42336 type:complete len:594 (+) Transcript_22999:81-1862(+)
MATLFRKEDAPSRITSVLRPPTAGLVPQAKASFADRIHGSEATSAAQQGQHFSFTVQNVEQLHAQGKVAEDDSTSLAAPSTSTMAPSVISGPTVSIGSGTMREGYGPSSVRRVTAVPSPQASRLGNIATSVAQPGAAPSMDDRLQRLEDKVKAFSQVLREAANKEFKSPEDELQHLSGGISACKEQRGNLQESVVRIAGLLQQEQKTRELWADSYKPNLLNTLDELSRSIDASVAQSAAMMDRRLDDTDIAVQKLKERVDAVYGDAARKRSSSSSTRSISGIGALATARAQAAAVAGSAGSVGTTPFSRFGRSAAGTPLSLSQAGSRTRSPLTTPTGERTPSAMSMHGDRGTLSRAMEAVEEQAEALHPEAADVSIASTAPRPLGSASSTASTGSRTLGTGGSGHFRPASRLSDASSCSSARDPARQPGEATTASSRPLLSQSPRSASSNRPRPLTSTLGRGATNQESTGTSEANKPEGLFSKLEALRAEHRNLMQTNSSLANRVHAVKAQQSHPASRLHSGQASCAQSLAPSGTNTPNKDNLIHLPGVRRPGLDYAGGQTGPLRPGFKPTGTVAPVPLRQGGTGTSCAATRP